VTLFSFLTCFANAVQADEPAPHSVSPAELAIVKAAESARVRAIESVYGAVVAIYGNERHGGGSGVIYDPAGFALTNHHVVAAAGTEGWAGLADGKLYRWKLIGTDPGGDVAIIKLADRVQFPAASLGDSSTVRIGDWAMAMGNPFALAEDQRPTVTLGIVSGVNRFQEGAGLNQLVYGNCIQVDSSINPGNSGGPLFNSRGQIIGINGRGSFEERGRVNVGLGYAISSNQIKMFIPELLSTKIAQHGTLDAVFGNREGGVVCYTLNTASPAARSGMALGDRLIAFDGTSITDANQFTSLISTHPAGWPSEVVVERGGERKTIRVRLSALPYERFVNQPKPAEPAPDGPKPDGKPKSEKMPGPQPKVERPTFPLDKAGKIRDIELNRTIARQLIERWRQSASTSATGWRINSEIRRTNTLVGDQTLVIATGGRIRVEFEIEGKRAIIASDGKKHWIHLPDQKPQTIERGKAFLNPHFAQAAALALSLGAFSPRDLGELALDGSDKAAGQICYRLSITDPATSEQLFLWFRAFDDSDGPQLALVKTGIGLDDDEPIASTLFSDFQLIGKALISNRRTLVHGLAEISDLAIVTSSVSALDTISDDTFQIPD
jgi:S1-C subfamily serine protease